MERGLDIGMYEFIDMEQEKMEKISMIREKYNAEKISIYDYTDWSFSRYTLKDFVYKHRNVFSDYTRRYELYYDGNYGIIKEITGINNLKSIWIWGFCRKEQKYIVIELNRNMKNKDIIKMFFEIVEVIG